MQRALAFCRDIKTFKLLHEEFAEAIASWKKEPGLKDSYTCAVEHVGGTCAFLYNFLQILTNHANRLSISKSPSTYNPKAPECGAPKGTLHQMHFLSEILIYLSADGSGAALRP